MRLVDADELIEHVWRDKLDSRELIAQMIATAPTIKEIPTPIPIHIFERLLELTEAETKGHWIHKATHIKCSQCGTEFNDDIINMNTDVGYPRFCPFCGTKMEVEE